MTLIDGGRSESEAQIIEPTEADQEGQLLMDGLLEEGVVQDGEAESRQESLKRVHYGKYFRWCTSQNIDF